ncbi:MAG: hypothetical protein QXX49_04610 [Candidatus Caldarchaeum sp.]
MDRKQASLVLVAAALVILFNLFQLVPPLSSTSLAIDFSLGESTSRPYILRVRVEKTRLVDEFHTATAPVPRMIVRLDDKTGVTNSNGYATFTTTPGKHVITISSPQLILPTYSVDVDIQDYITELRVLYIEDRFRIEAASVSIDSVSQTSHVRAFYTIPFNTTYYVGSPYLVYVNFEQYFKIFNGDSITAYTPNIEVNYQGPFNIMIPTEEGASMVSESTVQDLIQVIISLYSYVPAYRVENQLLRMS